MYENERRRSGSFRSIQSKSSYKGSRKYQLDETPARDRKSTKSLLPIPAPKVSTWYKSEAVPGEGATVNDLREEARRQQDYSIHRASLYSPRSHISLTLLLTYDFVLYVAYTPWDADFISEVIPEIVISSLLCLCTILGWAAWTYSFYVQRKRRRTSVDINTLRSRSKHVSRNQILNTAHFIFTFLVVALLIFYYSYRALHPSVVPLSATISGMFSSACNSQTSALSSIPQLQSLILILLPISYQILICGQNTRPPHLLWISIGITILVCILSFQLWSPASFLLFLILGHIGVLMSEVHSQSQATYNYFIQEMELMEALLMDRAKETDHKNKATELQRMIGNIAHDVKSPLASLRLGLDGLMSSLIRKEYAFDLSGIPTTNTAEENVSSAPATTYSVKEEIEICHSLEHGFAFLSMTISRAMDFQRTNKGFALIPDLTYIHLEPLVSRVVDCCKSTKAGAIIHVKPLARRLQAKVYTDESWLFDNLLCLVANAVKYTEDDVVSIRIQLRTEGGQDGQDFLRFEIEDSGRLCRDTLVPFRFLYP